MGSEQSLQTKKSVDKKEKKPVDKKVIKKPVVKKTIKGGFNYSSSPNHQYSQTPNHKYSPKPIMGEYSIPAYKLNKNHII